MEQESKARRSSDDWNETSRKLRGDASNRTEDLETIYEEFEKKFDLILV